MISGLRASSLKQRAGAEQHGTGIGMVDIPTKVMEIGSDGIITQ